MLVWHWYNRLCLSETCLKWQRRSKVPPNGRCVPSHDFSTQKVNVQLKFINKLLLFMVTLWIGKMWWSGAVNPPKEGLMFATTRPLVRCPRLSVLRPSLSSEISRPGIEHHAFPQCWPSSPLLHLPLLMWSLLKCVTKQKNFVRLIADLDVSQWKIHRRTISTSDDKQGRSRDV